VAEGDRHRNVEAPDGRAERVTELGSVAWTKGEFPSTVSDG